MGTRNSLFFGSAEAGNQNALLYSILENCKAHGLRPEDCLCQTIETLNALGPAPSAGQIAALTPARVAARKVNETQAA